MKNRFVWIVKHIPKYVRVVEKNGHIFMYKFDDADVYGSAWVWCSACQEYSHSRYLIPDWWKNYDGIEADELHNSPDNLDLIKNEIGQWVNSLR